MKRRFVWLAITAVAIGLATLAYHGPGRAIVRGHVGDIGATMGVYALLGFTAWSLRARVVATLGIALAIELGQLVWSSVGRSGVGALTIGSVFDPWDLLAYVVGTGVGAIYERTYVNSGPAARGAARSSRGMMGEHHDVGRAVDRERGRQ